MGEIELSRPLFSNVVVAAAAAAIALLALVACSGPRTEAQYIATLPQDVRPSYDVFARRCSKCHSISRPLDSGIDDDAYWVMYVRRMRLQPGSGISPSDEATILEFLRFYAKDRREKKAKKSAAVAPIPTDAGAEE